MTRYFGLITLFTCVIANPFLYSYNCNSSWCSTPSNACGSWRCTTYTYPYEYNCRRQSSPCDLGCSNHTGVLLGADFLYWNLCQTNLDYAVDHEIDVEGPILLGEGNTHSLEYDWSPGVRGYFGIQCCGFQVIGSYTWTKHKATGKKDYTDTDDVLIASLLHPDTGLSEAGIADGSLDLWYQTADCIFSREIEFCDYKLILRPLLGFRWLKIQQRLKVAYEEEQFVDNPEEVRWNSTLSGPGIHAGFDLFYRWNCGFGMYGLAAGSVIAAENKCRHIQQSLGDFDIPVSPPRINLKDRQQLCVPGYQLQAGITWDTCCSDCAFMRFRFCYEFNQWLNTPGLRRYHYGNEGVSNAANDGNIALHGGTFGIDLRF